MADLDLSDVGPEHFVSEVDAQIIEMNGRLDAMRAKHRPVEAQNLLRVRIGVMEKLREFLADMQGAAAPPPPADPDPVSDEIEEILSDDIID